MLKLRTSTPYFKLPTRDGTCFDLWQYRQRKNVVLIFLPDLSKDFLQATITKFEKNTSVYRNQNTEVLYIIYGYSQNHFQLDTKFPRLLDQDSTVARLYLDSDLVSSRKLAVFVLDRYGELWNQWQQNNRSDMPPQKEILDTLYLIERQCPE